MKIEYYQFLGVRNTASSEEIKAAYKKLSENWYPLDKPESERANAELQFGRISEAYQILSDKKWRTLYDKQLKKQTGGKYQDSSSKTSTSSPPHRQNEFGSSQGYDSGEEDNADEKADGRSRTRVKPTETVLGVNSLTADLGFCTVYAQPDTLLALRNPYMVYQEVLDNVKPDLSEEAFCQQLEEHHTKSGATTTTLVDVLGNETVISTTTGSYGETTVKAVRNKKLVSQMSVCEPLVADEEEATAPPESSKSGGEKGAKSFPSSDKTKKKGFKKKAAPAYLLFPLPPADKEKKIAFWKRFSKRKDGSSKDRSRSADSAKKHDNDGANKKIQQKDPKAESKQSKSQSTKHKTANKKSRGKK